MIEPNRLTVPGERRARARVEALFERIDELGTTIFQLPGPRLDLELRMVDLAELEAVADRHGLGPLLDEARQRVHDSLLLRTATRVEPFGFGSPIVPSGSADEMAMRTMAVEDAVAVAVVEDLLDAATASALSAPGRRLLGLAPLEPPASDGRDDDAEQGPEDREPALEAAADDADPAAEADAEDALDEAERRASVRQRRAALFVGGGAIALIAAYTVGVGLPGLVLVVLAVGLLAWLFAGE